MARTPKKLAHTYLTTSLASVYTVPASTRTQVTEIWLTNTDPKTTRNVTITAGTLAAKNAIGCKVAVAPADTVIISDAKVVLVSTASETLGGYVDGTNTGTATGGTSSTITLSTASTTSAVDDYYNGGIIELTNNSPAGTLGLSKIVTDYVGSTKVATVDSVWATYPVSAATTYIMGPLYITLFGIEEGV